MTQLTTNTPKKPTAFKPKSSGKGSYRQRMSPVHTWFGLLMGWLLYLVFFMGTLSYFKEEITIWTTPAITSNTAITNDDQLVWAAQKAQNDYPNANSITVTAGDGRTPLTITARVGEKRADREILLLTQDGTLAKASDWSRGGTFFTAYTTTYIIWIPALPDGLWGLPL